MTVNPQKYVKWLLSLPPANLTPPIREFMPTLKTARLLFDLASLAPDPDTIRRAACRLWYAPFEFGLGNRPETKQAALAALKPFERFLTGEEATNAREFIRGLSPEQLHAEPRIGRIPNGRYVEYRGPGRYAHLLKLAGKKNPADDLSERIFEADCALKESGCPCASESIAEILGWTAARGPFAGPRQRVESRLKPFKKRKPDTWPENAWRWTYALSYPDSTDGAIPESFEFIPWEAASPKASATGPRSTLRQEKKSGVPRSRKLGYCGRVL